jgi:hypothetical protein
LTCVGILYRLSRVRPAKTYVLVFHCRFICNYYRFVSWLIYFDFIWKFFLFLFPPAQREQHHRWSRSSTHRQSL